MARDEKHCCCDVRYHMHTHLLLSFQLTRHHSTSSKKERLEEYLQAQDLPQLTPEEIDEIDSAGSEVHHRHYKSGGSHMDE